MVTLLSIRNCKGGKSETESFQSSYLMTNGEEMYVNGIETKLQHMGEKKSRMSNKGPQFKVHNKL